MGYIITNIRSEYANRETGNREIIASVVCDDAASLPVQRADQTFVLSSDALDISTGDRYIINSSGQWILQPTQNVFSNVYTIPEIDSMITIIYQYMMYYHTEQETVDGTITFYSFGGNVGRLIIYGNGVQSDTQEFVGKKTANLWNEEYTNISGNLKYTPIFVGDGTFTLSTDTPSYSGNAPLFLLSGDVSTGASTSVNGVYRGVSRTTDSTNGYITIAFRRQSESSNPILYNTMLNSGDTAFPYEPFGYKIPISCGGETTPIYIAEPLRKALDGTDSVDIISSAGTITREVDAYGNALVTPTTESIDFPNIPTVSGENTLTVDTTLPPSKIVISGE